MLAVPPLLLHAFDAVLHSPELAGNTSAAAGLASALTSLVKRAVQLTKAAVSLQEGNSAPSAAAAATVTGRALAGEAAACFPAAVGELVGVHLKNLGNAVSKALVRSFSSTAPSRLRSLLGGQAAASAALLVVVLARSVVQLADAVEAVGPQLYSDCLARRPLYAMMWQSWSNFDSTYLTLPLQPLAAEEERSVEVQWQSWKRNVLQAVQPLLGGATLLGLAPLPAAAVAWLAAAVAGAGAAAEPQVAAGTLAAQLPADMRAATSLGRSRSISSISNVTVEQGSSSTSTSTSSATNNHDSRPASSSNSGSDALEDGSSSSCPQQKWGYLLHVGQYSPHWGAAAAAFDAKVFNIKTSYASAPSMPEAAEQYAGLYYDAVGVCKALADAAPVTVVCNNPGCGNLAGVSEAAASCKACSRCRCRYCSVGCQTGEWKRHKHACRQLAAAGYACEN
jgi:hypothetical protein